MLGWSELFIGLSKGFILTICTFNVEIHTCALIYIRLMFPRNFGNVASQFIDRFLIWSCTCPTVMLISSRGEGMWCGSLCSCSPRNVENSCYVPSTGLLTRQELVSLLFRGYLLLSRNSQIFPSSRWFSLSHLGCVTLLAPVTLCNSALVLTILGNPLVQITFSKYLPLQTFFPLLLTYLFPAFLPPHVFHFIFICKR